MKKSLLFLFITFSIGLFAQKKIDFGIEVQLNQNLVKKWDVGSVYSDYFRSMSILDASGDTLDIYLNKFGMDNNFEIPIYFRYSWKNRHFLDFKLSNSYNRLTMQGVSNYNQSFYETNFGTYQQFEAQAQADGFTDVDTTDYENFINAAKKNWESKISGVEEFQLLNMTMNYGYRFFPHKSIQGFIGAGYTIKGRYNKISYHHLDFSNDYVKDLSAIEPGFTKFAETSLYFNLLFGLELYRFRLSLFYQTGVGYLFSNAQQTEQIVYINPFTPYDRIHSYGFSLGVDLFSKDIGKTVKYDDITEENSSYSKVKRKKDKFDFGVRINRRGLNDLSTFYSEPANRLSILSKDSVYVYSGGSIIQAEYIEMVTFGDVKKIKWSPQFDLFGNFYLTKRFSLEAALGFSTLQFDVKTTELNAVIFKDTSGTQFLNGPELPKLRSGAYRKNFFLANMSAMFAIKIINRDIFDLRVKIGGGITTMAHVYAGNAGLPDGINELNIYEDFEEAYWFITDSDEFYAFQGEMNVKLDESPDEFLNKFPDEYIKTGWTPPKPVKSFYPTTKFGFDASIDKFTLGLTFERNLSYMDGFMLKNYNSIYFSIGYKLWNR